MDHEPVKDSLERKKKKSKKKHKTDEDAKESIVGDESKGSHLPHDDLATSKMKKKDKKKNKLDKDEVQDNKKETLHAKEDILQEGKQEDERKKKKKKKRKHQEIERADESTSKDIEDDVNRDEIEVKKKKKTKKSKRSSDDEGSHHDKELGNDGNKRREEQKVDVGQWGQASFESVEQKNKFIRLLGGFKNKEKQSDDKEKTNFLQRKRQFSSAAMSKSEEASLNKRLELQYEQAFDTSRNKRGLGLGYDPNQDKNLKTFHIDTNEASKSIKFD